MANGNDPANIPYIIAENGFYYVAYKEKVKVPEIVVSAKGVANGLSEEYNDGWDFGPDSYNPDYTGSEIPYTQTSGIQEAYNYISQSPKGGKIKIMGGKYIINATINIDATSAGDIPIYIEGSGAGNFGNQTYPDTSTSEGTLLYAADGLNANMIYVNNAPGGYLKISDIHFFGNPDNNTGSSIAIITFANGFQSEVSKCIFDNPPKNGYAIFTTDGMNLSFLNINKCLFQNAMASIVAQDNGMIYLNPLSSSNQTSGAGPYIIEDCYFYNTAGTHIFSAAPNMIIKNNFLEEMVNGINVGAINAQVIGNVILSNNTSSSAYQLLTNGYNALVKDNFFLYAGYQNIIIQGGSALIAGNYFDGTTGDTSTTAQTTYALNITAELATVSKGGLIFENNTFIGTYKSAFPFSFVSNTGLVIRNNYNMSGAGVILSPTTPSVPASGTAQQNTNPYPVNVYVYGGDVTEIQITRNGTAYTVLSVSTAIAMSGQVYKLNPGDSITLTYSTAPSWEWLSD
jgi:hypothetical protein